MTEPENEQNEEFDYGRKLPNGQFERYPIIAEGEFQKPILREYFHTKCRSRTKMSQRIAESYARDPGYYTHTFCSGCRDHLPVNEFKWVENGEVTDKTIGE